MAAVSKTRFVIKTINKISPAGLGLLRLLLRPAGRIALQARSLGGDGTIVTELRPRPLALSTARRGLGTRADELRHSLAVLIKPALNYRRDRAVALSDNNPRGDGNSLQREETTVKVDAAKNRLGAVVP